MQTIDDLDAQLRALIRAVKRLLAAVDFTADGVNRDVRIRNLWAAADALRELEELTQ